MKKCFQAGTGTVRVGAYIDYVHTFLLFGSKEEKVQLERKETK
jgi:hypothetical protein